MHTQRGKAETEERLQIASEGESHRALEQRAEAQQCAPLGAGRLRGPSA